MQVPSGPGRTIRLLGMQTGEEGCPDLKAFLSETMSAVRETPPVFILGEQSFDAFGDTSVDLYASFDAGFKFELSCSALPPLRLDCPAGFEGIFGTRLCASSCTGGNVWNADAQRCGCPADMVSSGGDCSFRCASAYHWNGEACVPCSTFKSYWNGNSCVSYSEVSDPTYGIVPELSCGAGQFLAGLRVRKGEIHDHLQLICRSFSGGVFDETLLYGPAVGGTGGNAREFICPPRSLVKSLVVANGDPYSYYGAPNSLMLACLNVATNAVSDSGSILGFTNGDSFSCQNPGEYVYGIRAQAESPDGSGYAGSIYGVKCRAP